MAAQRLTLLTMDQAFPNGLPAPPTDMPDWEPMDYDQFAACYQTKDLGCCEIPLLNVNLHPCQRPLDLSWVETLQKFKFANGIHKNAYPGVAILNTPDIPLDEYGKPDPTQMSVTIISAQHHGAAVIGMNIPPAEKTWTLHVMGFGIFSYICFLIKSILIVLNF